jgi:hypothetical protein
METKLNILEKIKGKNPFKVPNGYMESLTGQIMAGIPEKSLPIETKVVSMRDRIRPWLYLAGVFAGLLILFRVFINSVFPDTDQPDNASSYFQALVSGDFMLDITDDDLDYLEFIENQYIDREFAEEIDNMDY